MRTLLLFQLAGIPWPALSTVGSSKHSIRYHRPIGILYIVKRLSCQLQLPSSVLWRVLFCRESRLRKLVLSLSNNRSNHLAKLFHRVTLHFQLLEYYSTLSLLSLYSGLNLLKLCVTLNWECEYWMRRSFLTLINSTLLFKLFIKSRSLNY